MNGNQNSEQFLIYNPDRQDKILPWRENRNGNGKGKGEGKAKAKAKAKAGS